MPGDDGGRYSDTAEVCKEPELDLVGTGEDEFGFVEVTAGRNKTPNASRKRCRPIPMVAHAHGLTGENWAAAWLEARIDFGLDAEIDGCLFRAVGADGSFLRRKRASSDMGLWLREALAQYGKYEGRHLENIGSHSLKDTLI